jgi:hypothetical protein
MSIDAAYEGFTNMKKYKANPKRKVIDKRIFFFTPLF